MNLLVGLLSSGAIAYAAYRKQSLSGSGALAAVFVGTSLFAMGDPFWYTLLLVFFITSSVWSHFKRNAKRQVEEQFAKGGRRDGLQVLANGGAAVMFAMMYALLADTLMVWGFVGSLAAVTADTWATELGVLSSAAPRHILSGKRVDAGTSGAVTWPGTLAAASGAALIVVCGYALWPLEQLTVPWWKFLFAGTISGVIGSFVDSLLGATLQRLYICNVCHKTVERPRHCDRQATAAKGFRWMTNDAVNAIGSLSGGVAFIVLMR